MKYLCHFFSFLVLLGACTPGSKTASRKVSWDSPPEALEGLNPGNRAPELSYNNPKDSVIALSSLRGRIVLIDFWASWCGPCRMENPNVVTAYNKFRNQKFKGGEEGFTVYSLSLDMNKAGWTAAIQKDMLAWPYHVSDLKYWSSEGAAKYGVESIPTNWLIDGRGVILARNLRGEALENTLASLIAAPAEKK